MDGTAAPAPSAPPAGEEARLRRVLLAVSLALFCVQMDFFSLNLAIPRMARELEVSTTDMQWAISGYMLTGGAFLIVGGRLGDILGRRRMLLTGVAGFGVAAALAGAASSAELVIAARVLQGLASSLIFPVAIAVLTNEFPADRRARAIGLAYGIAGVGTAIGPFVGGGLVELLSWRWVLWVNVPFAAVALVLGRSSIRESRDPTVPRRVDLAGVAAVSAGIAAITYAVDRGESWGWGSGRILALFTAGLVLLVVFVLIERRVRFPLIDLALFRNIPYDVVTAGGLVANVCYVSTVFAVTIYLQQVRDLSPLEAGIVFLAQSAANAIAATLAGRIGGRLRPAQILAAALGTGGAGLLLLTFTDFWPLFLPAFALTGLGFGLGWAYVSVGTQAVVRPERAGEASGVTLTIVVALGGFAVAGTATALELLEGGGTSAGDAIHYALRAAAVLALAAAALFLVVPRLLGRERAAAL